MLKKIRESLEGLSEAVAALYVKGSDGKFHLQLEDDDAEPLRRAKEHEVGLRQIAERDLAAARAALQTAEARIAELTSSQSSDITALRADHERALNAAREEAARERAALQSAVSRVYVDQVATRIATEIAIDEGAAELLRDVIQRRLTVELVEGNPITRVLGPDGSPSVASPDDLKKEYLQNPKFASILKGNGASGGGAAGTHGGGGAAPIKKLSEMSEQERVVLARENPAEFRRLLAEEQA